LKRKKHRSRPSERRTFLSKAELSEGAWADPLTGRC
jgi:hypothetical protein